MTEALWVWKINKQWKDVGTTTCSMVQWALGARHRFDIRRITRRLLIDEVGREEGLLDCASFLPHHYLFSPFCPLLLLLPKEKQRKGSISHSPSLMTVSRLANSRLNGGGPARLFFYNGRQATLAGSHTTFFLSLSPREGREKKGPNSTEAEKSEAGAS